MKCMNVFLLIIIVVVLSGCADSHTTGTEKDTDLRVTINVTQYADNTGDVNINPGVDFASATGDTKQDTANTAETPTKVDLNLDDVNNPVTKITQAVDDKVESNVSEKVSGILSAADEKPIQTETQATGETEDAANIEYETRFHHTTWGSSDGGKSLVLCPAQDLVFDKCSAGGVLIPYHGIETDNRLAYWNIKEEPAGDIVCTKDGKEYRYLSDKKMVSGSCE